METRNPADAAQWRWGALTLLFLANTINFADRLVFNSVAQLVKVDLGLSDAMLGVVMGGAFGLFYAGLSVPLGRLADRTNRVLLIAVAIATWSISTSLTGFATSFATLVLARMLVGGAQAVFQPATATLVSDLFPARRRASALSLIYLGTSVGSFVALLFGAMIGARYGWRVAMIIAGMPGVLIAIAVALSLRDPQRQRSVRRSAPAATDQKNFLRAIVTCLRSPGFLWIAIIGVCFAFSVYVAGLWLPLFFIRNFGMSVVEVGRYSAFASGITGAVGTLGAGYLCDKFRDRTAHVELKALTILMAAIIPAFLLTVFATDRTFAIAGMFLVNFFAYAYLTPFVMLVQSATTMETRALFLAVVLAVDNVVALTLGLPLVGFLSDHFEPLLGARSIGFAICLCVVAAVIGLFAIWRLQLVFRESPAVSR